MMLDGLMSRCTSPFSWATSSAEATCAATLAARCGSSGPSRLISVPSSVPSTQRVAMKTVPFSSPASYSGTTFGWSSAATVLASRRRRSRTTGSAATSGSTTLRATGRLSRS